MKVKKQCVIYGIIFTIHDTRMTICSKKHVGEHMFENPSHITNEKSEPDIGNKIIKSKKFQNEMVIL